jgi:hypothetical protein
MLIMMGQFEEHYICDEEGHVERRRRASAKEERRKFFLTGGRASESTGCSRAAQVGTSRPATR